MNMLLSILMNLLYVCVTVSWMIAIAVNIIYLRYNEIGNFTKANVINSYSRSLFTTLCLIFILFCIREIDSVLLQ